MRQATEFSATFGDSDSDLQVEGNRNASTPAGVVKERVVAIVNETRRRDSGVVERSKGTWLKHWRRGNRVHTSTAIIQCEMAVANLRTALLIA